MARTPRPMNIVALLVALGVNGTAAQYEAGEVVCPKATGPITMDGKIDEPAWTQAPKVGPLLTLGARLIPARGLTYAKMLYDRSALYLAVTCAAPAPKALKRHSRDTRNVWSADHIEIFLNPFPDAEDYYHLVFDRAGNLFDSWHTQVASDRKGANWDGAWRVTIAQTPEGWTAEVALPFAVFGTGTPQPGDLWRLKACRDGGPVGPIAWPPNGGSGFHNRLADAALYFDTENLLVDGHFEGSKLGKTASKPWAFSLTSREVDNKPQGTLEIVPGGVKPGNQALRFTKLGPALWWPQVWSSGYRLQPSGAYELSIMAKGSIPGINLRATGFSKKASAKMSRGFTPSKTKFSRLAFRFVVPDGTEKVIVGLSAPKGAAGEVLLDNAVLRRVLLSDDAAKAAAYMHAPPDWGPDPDPVQGLESLRERAGHKPWDLFWRGDDLMLSAVMFKDRQYGTWILMPDRSPTPEYVLTASVWPAWNANGSRLQLAGHRPRPDGWPWRSSWFCNADFSRMVIKPNQSLVIWDPEDPNVYYGHRSDLGKVWKFDFRTGKGRVLAEWKPRLLERCYGLTKDNRSLFIANHDCGLWVPYTPADKPVPYVHLLGPAMAPDRSGKIGGGSVFTNSKFGPLFRILIGARVYIEDGRMERVIAPISGHTEHLEAFISGRVKFPADAKLPQTRDLEELFQIYHLYPSCSHGHVSYSPDGEYICYDGGPSHRRVRDGGDSHSVGIGCGYHVCWLFDPRFYVTVNRGFRTDYSRPTNCSLVCQVFSDGTWQPVCDAKKLPSGYYYQGNFAMPSRDATKIHYASSMLGVSKTYIAFAARPQAPRSVRWQADGAAVVLRWNAPPRHKEIKGYLVYRSRRSGSGYVQITHQPVRDATYRDATIEPGRAYYYVVTSLEHFGLESGYSAEAARAGVGLTAGIKEPIVVYVEAEDALVDLSTGQKPGVSRGRDQLGASNWYYVYRTPKAKRVAATPTPGVAQLTVRAPQPGSYFIWLRVRRGQDGEPGWTVAVDEKTVGHVACSQPEWTWVKAGDRAVELKAGLCALALATVDEGAQADIACLATDPQFRPRGVRPEDRDAPAPVQGLKVVNVRERHVQLEWEANSDPDLWYYNVYDARQPIAKPEQKHLLGSPTCTELIDWGLRAGSTYRYAVTAVDRRANESQLGAVVEAVVPARLYPPQELELRFDQAKVTGEFDRVKARGTRGERYLKIADRAAVEELALASASWEIELNHGGAHYFWLRYLPQDRKGRGREKKQHVKVLLDGKPITVLGGGLTDLNVPKNGIRPEFWTWARPVNVDLIGVELPADRHTLTLRDLHPSIRYDVLFITDEPSFLPTDGRLRQRAYK